MQTVRVTKAMVLWSLLAAVLLGAPSALAADEEGPAKKGGKTRAAKKDAGDEAAGAGVCPALVGHEQAIDTLAGEIVRYQKIAGVKGKELVASTLLDSISRAKAALIDAGVPDGDLEAALEALIADKQAGRTSDYEAAAATAETGTVPTVTNPAGTNGGTHSFSADELKALKHAVTYGETKGLSAGPALKSAIAEKDDLAVEGLILGARNFEAACTALGSRCYRLEQDLSSPFPQGGTPLEWSIAKGNTKAAVMLVAAGGQGSAMNAVQAGNSTVLGAMIAGGVSISDEELQKAIDSKNTDIVKVILDSGKEPTIKHFVTMAKYPELLSQFERVLAANPDYLNETQIGGTTALVSAIRAKNGPALKHLIANNVELDKIPNPGELSPLAEAVTAQVKENVELMINAGVALGSTTTEVAKSPLGIAISKKNAALVKLCITAGFALDEYEYMNHLVKVVISGLSPAYAGSTEYRWGSGGEKKDAAGILQAIRDGDWYVGAPQALQDIGKLLVDNWAR